ncbi:uncharacterized protein LOC109614805 isoform X2 [Esox lucius]|uniref:uncharacterized protein LOC109614805 isoform X2 n=1 Tax=Esox lucius TaxID=8010 RepID=UPI0014777BDF|nr:uncharacterized protein LOC109614805 isoform X2 [Esox lucius]
MTRTKELSDFQRGTVIGCHLSKQSVRQISALLELPRSTVSAVIVKWKRLGATTAQPRSGRPHKLTERDRRVLNRVARKTRRSSVATLTTEFQTTTGSNVSTRTVRRELTVMGFRGKGARQKLIVPNTKRRQEEACAEESCGLQDCGLTGLGEEGRVEGGAEVEACAEESCGLQDCGLTGLGEEGRVEGGAEVEACAEESCGLQDCGLTGLGEEGRVEGGAEVEACAEESCGLQDCGLTGLGEEGRVEGGAEVEDGTEEAH